MSKRNRGRDRDMFGGLQDTPSLEEAGDAILEPTSYL